MADATEQEPRQVQPTPPRFGRNVSRPRVSHALEVVDEGTSVLDEIDRLISLAAFDASAAVA